jgi:hypothetical protein
MGPYKFKKPRDIELSANVAMSQSRPKSDVHVKSALLFITTEQWTSREVSWGPLTDIAGSALSRSR